MGFFGEVFKGVRMGNFSANVAIILKQQFGFTANMDSLNRMVKGYNGMCTEHAIAVKFLTEHMRNDADRLKAKFPQEGLRKNFDSYIRTAKVMKEAGLFGLSDQKVVDDLVEVGRTQYGVN
jgi:hypothetical protein